MSSALICATNLPDLHNGRMRLLPLGPELTGFPGDDINLDLDRVPKDRLHRRSGGENGHAFEKLFIRGVVAIELTNIPEMDGGLDHIVQGTSRGLQNFLNLSQSVERFFLDRASDRLGGLRVHGPLAAD